MSALTWVLTCPVDNMQRSAVPEEVYAVGPDPFLHRGQVDRCFANKRSVNSARCVAAFSHPGSRRLAARSISGVTSLTYQQHHRVRAAATKTQDQHRKAGNKHGDASAAL